MNSKKSSPSSEYVTGSLLSEGKTKRIFQVANQEDLVVMVSKDDITAGDGAKHDILEDKGQIANQTTCNVFRLLQECGLPLAFMTQNGPSSFVGPKCRMLPYEVVVRREAHGSFLKRSPQLTKGHLFPRLVVEFFLKTNGKRWKSVELICDDPLMAYDDGQPEIQLFHPGSPPREPFVTLPSSDVFAQADEWTLFEPMRSIARRAFLVLEKAWQLEGRKLVDFKVEFGVDTKGQLLLADVIDNDSWRVVEQDRYIDKQMYRDGGALEDVAASYKAVAEITSRFRIPTQRLILWRGSESDDVERFAGALGEFAPLMSVVTCSAHKKPVEAYSTLHQLAQQVPDSVVIAFIGRSNGAGPTLSAVSHLPVITVPANAKEFPEDVWSSLRAPSDVPVMTVLEPSNAVLAALQILAARNPRIYARLRGELEKRLTNTVVL